MTATIHHVEKARLTDPPAGFTGNVRSRAIYCSDKDPLHLYVHQLAQGARLRTAPRNTDCIIYVWKGTVRAGRQRLAAGSSFVVEHGACVEVTGVEESSE